MTVARTTPCDVVLRRACPTCGEEIEQVNKATYDAEFTGQVPACSMCGGLVTLTVTRAA